MVGVDAHMSLLYTEHGDSAPTLTDIMVFLTGCDAPPPLGFGDVEPSIAFSSVLSLPTVSTCSLTLPLPLDFPTDFASFKEKMDFAILGSQGFFWTTLMLHAHISYNIIAAEVTMTLYCNSSVHVRRCFQLSISNCDKLRYIRHKLQCSFKQIDSILITGC